MTDHLAIVETVCADLTANRTPVTFTAIAAQTGISRTTLYRNPDLRAAIDDHRHGRGTLAELTSEIGHLRTALHALADRVRNQEERLRRLEPRGQRQAN